MSVEFIEAATRLALTRRKQHFDQMVEQVMARCQSPIEQQMGVALIASPIACLSFPCVIANIDIDDGMHGFYLWPQMPVRAFRADFGVMMLTHVGRFRVAVECDGHDFHERTKEQAAHDKGRDRAFLDEGWPVMRFTGSEIHRDAQKCADEVGGVLFRQFQQAITQKRQELMS